MTGGAYTEEELARMTEIERKVLSKVKAKNVPFDVPLVDPLTDEFAPFKNMERKALVNMGAYDAIRLVLEEERLAQEAYERELAEEAAAEAAEKTAQNKE